MVNIIFLNKTTIFILVISACLLDVFSCINVKKNNAIEYPDYKLNPLTTTIFDIQHRSYELYMQMRIKYSNFNNLETEKINKLFNSQNKILYNIVNKILISKKAEDFKDQERDFFKLKKEIETNIAPYVLFIKVKDIYFDMIYLKDDKAK